LHNNFDINKYEGKNEEEQAEKQAKISLRIAALIKTSK